MLSFSTLSILFSNSVTLRRDISIFNRVAIVVLLYCFLEAIIGIFLINKGIDLHGGLLQITNITQTFHSFIFIISALILILTSFFPRKGWTPKRSNVEGAFNSLENSFDYIAENINKKGEHLKIIEYPLILLFVVNGAILLISINNDLAYFFELSSYWWLFMGLILISLVNFKCKFFNFKVVIITSFICKIVIGLITIIFSFFDIYITNIISIILLVIITWGFIKSKKKLNIYLNWFWTVIYHLYDYSLNLESSIFIQKFLNSFLDKYKLNMMDNEIFDIIEHINELSLPTGGSPPPQIDPVTWGYFLQEKENNMDSDSVFWNKHLALKEAIIKLNKEWGDVKRLIFLKQASELILKNNLTILDNFRTVLGQEKRSLDFYKNKLIFYGKTNFLNDTLNLVLDP
jgi:hypothetical protein